MEKKLRDEDDDREEPGRRRPTRWAADSRPVVAEYKLAARLGIGQHLVDTLAGALKTHAKGVFRTRNAKPNWRPRPHSRYASRMARRCVENRYATRDDNDKTEDAGEAIHA